MKRRVNDTRRFLRLFFLLTVCRDGNEWRERRRKKKRTWRPASFLFFFFFWTEPRLLNGAHVMAMCLRAGAEVVGAFKFICFTLLPSLHFLFRLIFIVLSNSLFKELRGACASPCFFFHFLPPPFSVVFFAVHCSRRRIVQVFTFSRGKKWTETPHLQVHVLFTRDRFCSIKKKK